MSDKLSALMQGVVEQLPKEETTHEEALIEALDRALEATTPARPGCPWDELEGDNEREEERICIPEGD